MLTFEYHNVKCKTVYIFNINNCTFINVTLLIPSSLPSFIFPHPILLYILLISLYLQDVKTGVIQV